jgi:hypothetical protein
VSGSGKRIGLKPTNRIQSSGFKFARPGCREWDGQ